MLAELADPVERGAHAVQFYDSVDALVPSVARFVGGGLAKGECAIVLARPEHGAAFEEAITESGVDIDACDGRYLTIDATALLPDFDLRAFAETVGGLVRGLAEPGPLRIYGEMVALLEETGEREDALAVEGWWNALRSRVPFTLFCAYRGSAHADLAATHDLHVPSPSPGPRHAGRVTRAFEPTRYAVPLARRLVTDALEGWGLDPEVATLVLTELATNAVEHTTLRFKVSVTRLGRTVRVAVSDQSSRPLPPPSPPPAVATGGRGLVLVDALAKEWGCDVHRDGKTVWALVG
ncbi:MAG TPA: MEDS domain-containing protein [Mycobacteriales bacterium]